jgi:hypothetical protein
VEKYYNYVFLANLFAGFLVAYAKVGSLLKERIIEVKYHRPKFILLWPWYLGVFLTKKIK